jgi:hypothetical protein
MYFCVDEVVVLAARPTRRLAGLATKQDGSEPVSTLHNQKQLSLPFDAMSWHLPLRMFSELR